MVALQNGNDLFQFTILGYQYPDTDDRNFDGNWLLMQFRIKRGDFIWSSKYPALLTWEVEDISDWVGELAKNRSLQNKTLRFAEPNLVWEERGFLGLKRIIRIHFAEELQPPDWEDEMPCFLDFYLDQAELSKLERALRLELSRFPVREE